MSHREHLEDHDCTTPQPPNKSEGACVELKECHESGEDKDKDYYFMDTTLLGQMHGECMWEDHEMHKIIRFSLQLVNVRSLFQFLSLVVMLKGFMLTEINCLKWNIR